MKKYALAMGAAIAALAPSTVMAEGNPDGFRTLGSGEDDNRAWIGITAGWHGSHLRYSDLSKACFPDDKWLGSGLFSVFFEYDFLDQRQLAVRPEIAFLNRGGTLSNSRSGLTFDKGDGVAHPVGETRYKLFSHYIDIRVPVAYQFLDSDSKVRPYVFAAPILGLSTGGNATLRAYDEEGEYGGYMVNLNTSNMKGAELALGLGAGAKFMFDIAGMPFFAGIEAGYEFGLTDTFGAKEKNGEAYIVNEPSDPASGKRAKGWRHIDGLEIKATIGISLSAFSRKAPAEAPVVIAPQPEPEPVPEPTPVPEPEPAPEPVSTLPAPARDHGCYTLDEIISLMAKGERVEGKTICSISDINFAFGKSEINPASFPFLDKLARFMTRTNTRIEVKGHTDNIGSEEVNTRLSEDRALAVITYLVG
ncbi:MAG: OmpA family protein, partial [Muribaculaceae bacterium]|nr:OmpA family protein [Muribaculaceae bacterium]